VRVEHASEDSLERRNLRLAGAVLEELARVLPELAGRGVGAHALDARAQELARLPGRAERRTLRGTRVVLDGAHVPESLALVLRDLARDPELAPDPVVVLGMGSEKDARGLLKALQGRADRVLCTSPGDGPYRHPMELRALALELGLAAEAFPEPPSALERAASAAGSAGWVLVTGSLHLVGALRPLTTG
jgi:dihydrofolate synthase/folylpolyglutamate synthase